LYKTLFTINFVKNTYEFYNFVRNNYPQKNYLSIMILKKNSRKKSFPKNLFNKFVRKYHVKFLVLHFCTSYNDLRKTQYHNMKLDLNTKEKKKEISK